MHMNITEIRRLQKVIDNDDSWLEEECAGSPHHGSMSGDERRKVEKDLADALAPEYSI